MKCSAKKEEKTHSIRIIKDWIPRAFYIAKVPPGFDDPWHLHIANMIKGQTKLLSQQRQLNSLQNVENQLTFPHDLKNNFDQVTILGPKNNNNNNNNEEEEEAELTSPMREQ